MDILEKIRIVIVAEKINITVPRGEWDEKLLWKILTQAGISLTGTGTTEDDVKFTVPLEQIDSAVTKLKEYGFDHTLIPKGEDRAVIKMTCSQ